MFASSLKKIMKRDDGISPVIGTILMIVATVIIGGAVYAAISQYNGASAKPPTDAAFKAQSADTNGDGIYDTIKVTYLSGPANLTNVRVALTPSTGTMDGGTSAHVYAGKWNAGDFETYDLNAPAQLGAVFVTVALGGTTVLDQSISLEQVV